MSRKIRVVVDCDNTWGLPGRPIDDGQTIIYLAGRPDVEIVGITCTHGNGSVDEVFDATRWLVGALGLCGLPVLKGSSGAGDYDTEAAAWLAAKADDEPGSLALLAIGTMSNLLGAKMKDPAFFGKIARVAAMGGYLHPLPVRGWNKIGELNLSRDPAATATLLGAECPVTVMSAQICLQAPFGMDELAPIARTDRASYFYMLSYLMGTIRRHYGAQEYLWDLLPAVFISHPELFHRREMRVSTNPARLSTGFLVPDDSGPAIDVPDYIVDVDSFYKTLYAAWERAPLRCE
jgi:purine nucleosidase